MDLAGVSALDHQPHLGTGFLPYQVMVDGGRDQKRGNGRQLGGRVAVREHDEVGALGDGR